MVDLADQLATDPVEHPGEAIITTYDNEVPLW
jgi:hypothetical protein